MREAKEIERENEETGTAKKKPRGLSFSTDNADYILRLGCHIAEHKAENLSCIDAIVLETGFNSYDELSLDVLLRCPQYTRLMEKNLELDEPRPIFFVDTPPIECLKKSGMIGYWADLLLEGIGIALPFQYFTLQHLLTLPLALPLVSYITSPINLISDKFAEINSYLLLSKFYIPSGLRSAISAKKIEENIAPKMKRRESKKPNILIEYGAAHADIKPYLKHKKLRELVVKLHGLWNLFPHDKSYANYVGEINFDINFDSDSGGIGEVVFKENHACYNHRHYNRDIEKIVGYEKIIYKI